jgi:LysM repeat protein
VDPARRRELTRFGAPAAFLLAVTIAVLLVKAGLDNSGGEPAAVTTSTAAARTTAPPPTTTLVLTNSATTTSANAQYYVIETGDTLGAIAAKYDTTVEQLLTLNPDVDPNALHPGDRIRVG